MKLNHDEARILGKKILEYNFHHALWFKKRLEQALFREDGSMRISPAQLNILWAIRDFGIDTLPQLSAFLITSKSSLSITMTKMVKEGYLCKKMPVEGDDRRKVYFYVTNQGSKLLDSIEKKGVESLAAFCQTLSPAQVQTLDNCLHQLSQIYR